MKKTFIGFTKVSIFLLVLGVAVLSCHAFAQSPLNWENSQKYDDGEDSSVSVTPSGLVVEFHKSQNSNTIWYHVGLARQTFDGRNYVSWGDSHSLDYNGRRPSVAITKEGYVVLVYSLGAYSGYGKDVQMRYWVGQLNPNGDTKQTIDWKVKDAFYDTGQYASLSFNTNNVLVDVHESFKTSGLFYRIGHLRNPVAGQYDIVWDSGNGGKYYDEGVNPHISINEWNQVVEVHQTKSSESLLHFRRGHLYPGSIDWASQDSFRYDNDSKQAAVALTNESKVIEAASRNNAVFSRTGNLRPNYARVDWSNAVQISRYGYQGITPSIATNGVVAISTWTSDKKLYYSIAPVR